MSKRKTRRTGDCSDSFNISQLVDIDFDSSVVQFQSKKETELPWKQLTNVKLLEMKVARKKNQALVA